ncbi:glycerol 2-dehydrogenase (NADP+) [Pancytospora philotis]|nr:glycerol 2-dehydrogenase (NADP+) [Pancytospora philotis]
MEYNLNSGYKIQAIGMGTWMLVEEKETLAALEAAYDAGCRHFDTAAAYHNEEIIGKFLADKNRHDLFITSKLWNDCHDRVEEACDETLARLGTDYLDLYLIHWPCNSTGELDLARVWGDMEKLVKAKKVHSIGVANFGPKNLAKLLSVCTIKPAVDQVELHPYLPQEEIRQICRKNEIIVIAYSSLGSTAVANSVKNDDTIKWIAERHKTSPEIVLLSYGVMLGCCVIPRSRNPKHIKSNRQLIPLSSEDMREIEAIKIRHRYIKHEQFGEHVFE